MCRIAMKHDVCDYLIISHVSFREFSNIFEKLTSHSLVDRTPKMITTTFKKLPQV